MSIENSIKRYGHYAVDNLGCAAIAGGIAAVAIVAIPGVKLTIAGAALATLISNTTARFLFAHVKEANKNTFLTRAASLAIGFGAANMVGLPVGLIASAITTCVAVYFEHAIR